eukprot:gene28318-34193_t
MFSTNTAGDKKRKRGAITIQCAYRCYLARRSARDRYRARYRKIYDADSKTFGYQNKKTLDVFEELPAYFGKLSDLPNPRDYQAPDEYDPGSENTGNLYALVLSNTTYTLGKWIPFPTAQELDNDYESIKSLLTHEFVGKVRPENAITLKNPSTNDVKDALKHLKKIVRRQGSLLIYIATHIIGVNGNKDPDNKKETGYFAFRNSIWGKTKEIINSCIGLVEFSNYINQINCRQKVIMVNYAHLPPPRKAVFMPSKQIYPPADFMCRLAHLCSCPVLTNCSTGFKVRQYAKGHPDIKLRTIHSEEVAQVRPVTSGSSSSTAKNSPTPTPTRTTRARQVLPGNELTEEDGFPQLRITHHKPSLYHAIYLQFYTPFYEQVLNNFGIQIPFGITKSVKPAPPHPVWTQNEDTGYAIKVELPDDKQIRNHWLSLQAWRAKRTIAKPYNLAKQSYRYYKRVSQQSPRQYSHAYQTYTMFGYAIISALKGGASVPTEEYVTLYDVYSYVCHVMDTLSSNMLSSALQAKRDAASKAAEEEAEGKAAISLDVKENQYKKSKKEKPGADKGGKGKGDGTSRANKKDKKKKKGGHDDSGEENKKVVVQTPCLYFPNMQKAEEYMSAICWCRCGCPAAPERPYIIDTKSTSVLLEWFNPPFDGVPPLYYRLYMRNITRNFSHWEEVYYPGRKIFSTKFLVRNLPIGVACQFKVEAFNHGGWSLSSEFSTYVTPGEDSLPITKAMRWYRVRQGGVLAILDHIKLHQDSKEEVLTGLKLLYGLGSNSYGFKSSKFALMITEKCFELLHIFPRVPEVVNYSFLVLTCAMFGKNERKVRQYCTTHNIDDIVAKQMETHRYHSGVVNSIQGLRGVANMHKYLPPMTDFKYKVNFPANINQAEPESDEELEDDNQTVDEGYVLGDDLGGEK